ncbi:MAG TPA: hypothetical protein VHE30_22395 [Polyangiaceae bacterium]|nr:hypothetical protein [Polyangiaceae bacterium]
MTVTLVAVALATGCDGDATDASRVVDNGGDAGVASGEFCSGAVQLANSSQGNSFCVVKGDGAVWCWGENGCGQLGASAPPFMTAPIPAAPPDAGSRFESVSVGWTTTCAVDSSRSGVCWGSPLPSVAPSCSSGSAVTRPAGLPTRLSMIASGSDHACAVAEDGSAWCWGTNTNGQLGDGTEADRSHALPVVGLSSRVAAIAAGHDDTCALTLDGALWCWGWNYAGELGDGTTETRRLPTPVSGMSSGVASVSVGGSDTCAVKTDGSVWCWGHNSTGTVGDGTTAERLTPSRVELDLPVKAVAAGYAHTCALASDGTVWCWGTNLSGSLGFPASCDGGRCANPTPSMVTGLPSPVTAITAGYDSTCALESDGTVWCWGSNSGGQLGDGTRTARFEPARVLSCGG